MKKCKKCDCIVGMNYPYYSYGDYYLCEDCGDEESRKAREKYAELMKKLRDETGSSIKKAKIAYAKCDYNYDKAKELLIYVENPDIKLADGRCLEIKIKGEKQ